MRKGRQLAVCDCETDPFLFGRIPKPFLWDFFDGKNHITIEHTSDFIAFIENQPPTICYAHNGGKFDYHMPGFLDALEPFAKITIINGRLAKFTIGEVEFRDSVNILPIALADYKKEEIDYTKFEADVRKFHMPEIVEYLHKDTEYLYEIVKKFRDTYGDGLTLAGSAMKFWQQRSGIEAPKSTGGFYREVSPYYYGGRVECFRKGIIDEPFKMVDINSAYPFAMLHDHPLSTDYTESVPKHESHSIPDIIPQSLYSVAGISNGGLPFRDGGNSLRFPSDADVRNYRVTGWELIAGIKTNTLRIVKIYSRKDFRQFINFNKYIHYFYDIKKSAAKESAEYIFAKLFMNSLYGKFGANPDAYSNFQIIPPQFVHAAKMDGSRFAGELGKWAVIETDLEEAQKRYYNVATAASITGFVRAYLWEHVCKVRASGGEVLYCDTDSMAYTGSADGFRLDKELGGWSDEGRFKRGGIGGKKLYAFEYEKPKYKDGKEIKYKFGCKGVRITAEQILEVCSGKTVQYKREAPSYGTRLGITEDGEVARTPQVRFVTRNVNCT